MMLTQKVKETVIRTVKTEPLILKTLHTATLQLESYLNLNTHFQTIQPKQLCYLETER